MHTHGLTLIHKMDVLKKFFFCVRFSKTEDEWGVDERRWNVKK